MSLGNCNEKVDIEIAENELIDYSIQYNEETID